MSTKLSTIYSHEARQRELERQLSLLPEQDAAWLLVERLADPYPPLRQIAAQELGRRMYSDIARLLVYLVRKQRIPAEFFKEVNPPAVDIPSATDEVRIAAILALRGARDEDSRNALIEAAQSALADMRYQALVSLYHVDLSRDQWLDLLPDRLRDSDDEVVVVASQITSQLKLYDLLPLLWEAHDKHHNQSRLQIAFSLAEMIGQAPSSLRQPDGSEIQTLVKECMHALEDEVTLAAASHALAALGHEHAIEPLRKVLAKWFVHPILKVGAAASLVQLGDAQGNAYLSQMLYHRRKDARGYAIQLVGKLRLTSHFSYLVEVARSDDYHADTAVLALCDWGTEEALEVIRELADTHSDDDVRLVARECLENIADSPSFSSSGSELRL